MVEHIEGSGTHERVFEKYNMWEVSCVFFESGYSAIITYKL